VEADFRVRPAGSGDHRTDIGRLLITRPDQPGIVAAVPGFRFSSGANITKSRRYSADPFGGTIFLRTEFRETGLAASSDDLPASFGEIAGLFSIRWQMARTGPAKGRTR
jgi:formyltetrahydrofolate deformylase